jgi:hypothetical protein
MAGGRSKTIHQITIAEAVNSRNNSKEVFYYSP